MHATGVPMFLRRLKVTIRQQARVDALRRHWDEAGVEFGLCLCGCGQRTELASATKNGLVRGFPKRRLRGHEAKGLRWATDPNPGGLCVCGCGRETTTFFTSKRARTPRHAFYIQGHQARKSPVDYVAEDRGFESPCWIWQRKITRGYGITREDGRERVAHVVAWEAEFGPVPDGKQLHHRCEVRACVNAAHLVPLTSLEHMGEHARLRRVARYAA